MLCLSLMSTSEHHASTDSLPGSAEALSQAWQAWGGSFPSFMADLDRRGVPYLSHSKVATVERCPRCYYRQFVLGEQPASDALTTGLLFHQAAAAFYLRRREAPLGGAPAAVATAPPPHPSPTEQPLLDNALTLMAQHAWDGHEVVGVEEIFFMDVGMDLPPVIGVIDLILRVGPSYVVVDHKTGKRFGEPDHDQLVLYAEYIRRRYGAAECRAAFDEYRLVPNLKRIRTPAFRRTAVAVGTSHLPALVGCYRRAWGEMLVAATRGARTAPGAECWFCRASDRVWR